MSYSKILRKLTNMFAFYIHINIFNLFAILSLLQNIIIRYLKPIKHFKFISKSYKNLLIYFQFTMLQLMQQYTQYIYLSLHQKAQILQFQINSHIPNHIQYLILLAKHIYKSIDHRWVCFSTEFLTSSFQHPFPFPVPSPFHFLFAPSFISLSPPPPSFSLFHSSQNLAIEILDAAY